MGRTYICIDLKSFYASVECVDRGLDPFTCDLVVADPDRSANTICLAITPSMKSKGVKNRCRIRDIPESMDYIIAMPRMSRYIEVSCEVYRTLLRNVCRDDVWPYSIDESFLNATPYLRSGISAREFAAMLIAAVREGTGIAATAGIGPNMLLAKVALDICAKHADDGIGVLDRDGFMRDIWFHHPITDIWGIGHGIARRLALRGIYDLAGICAERPEVIRSMFGVNGEILVDHAWGLEPCTIRDVQRYVPVARSLSNGQVLMRDYSFDEARIVLREMIHGSCLDLVEKGAACGGVGLFIGYSGSMLRGRDDLDAREAAASLRAGGQRSLGRTTASERAITDSILDIYDRTVSPYAKIRRVNITLSGVLPASMTTYTLFDDVEAERREARLSRAEISVRKRFGPNALLRGTSYLEAANARERNLQIGGHRA